MIKETAILSTVGLAGLAGLLMFAYGLSQLADQLLPPIVQIGYPSGDCVAVLSKDPAHSCGNLPTRYTTEYVADR